MSESEMDTQEIQKVEQPKKESAAELRKIDDIRNSNAIGFGSTRVVVKNPESPDDIYKIDIPSIRRAYTDIGHPDYPGHEQAVHDNLRKKLDDERIKREKERIKALYKHFPNNVLPQEIAIMEIPVNMDILATVYRTQNERPSKEFSKVIVENGGLPVRIPAIVETQVPYLDEYGESFHTLYPEDHLRTQEDREAYDNLTQNIFDVNVNPDLDAFNRLYPETAEFFSKVDDPDINEKIYHFMTRCAEFARETGDIVDFAGEKNIFFDEMAKDFAIRDGLIGNPHKETLLIQARELLKKVSFGNELKVEEQNALKNAVNFTRTVNMFVDKRDRIQLVDPNLDLTPADIRNALSPAPAVAGVGD